ncbi:MAG: HD domain-containing protein [Acidimicrobiia bacterium]
MTDIVQFTQMRNGTRDEYQLLHRLERRHVDALPDRIMAALLRLDDSLAGYRVTRLEHSLQTATRARADGADIELVVAALVHDLGDELAPENHSQLAAAIIRPYVRAEVTWVVEMHGLFQMVFYGEHVGVDSNGRDAYREHPWFDSCARFCERWDQASFDPDYRWAPLDSFEPLLREVFGRPAFDPLILQELPRAAPS